MDFDDGADDGEAANEFADFASDEPLPEFNQKDSILFVVDARRGMRECGPGGGMTFFEQSLACAQACMRDRILNGEHDLVGVLLFGTEKSKAPQGHQGFANVYLLKELEQPSAMSMRELGLVCEAEAAANGTAKPEANVAAAASAIADFGCMDGSEDVELANVLWAASLLFNSAACKHTRRRLYLMTGDDNPCPNAAVRTRALTRSRDLQDAHVWIEPFFFAPAHRPFDLSPGSLWYDLVGHVRDNYKGPPPQAESSGGGVGTFREPEGLEEDRSTAWLSTCVMSGEDDLLERVRRKAHRKRVTWSAELTIRDGYALSCIMVSLVRPAPNPSKVKLEARTNELLQTASVNRCTSHGGELEKSDIWKGYNFGGKWVYFEPYEVSGFGREGFVSGLTLLGFKDADRLKLQHHVGPSKFLEPCEKVPGSSQAMAALVQSMQAKGKIGLARMVKGKVGGVTMVALLPQRHEVDGPSGATAMPCGLHVVPLPFAEDLRSIARPPPLAADEFTKEQMSAARGLVASLKLPAHKSPVGRVSNPAVHTHFAYLQMLALGLPGVDVEVTVDGTLPDGAWLSERQQDLDGFREAFGLPDVLEAEAAGNKRPSSGGSGGPSKVAKVKVAPPESMAEWVLAQSEGRLGSLTVALLKEFCKAHDLPVSGKKDGALRSEDTCVERCLHGLCFATLACVVCGSPTPSALTPTDLQARIHDFLEKVKGESGKDTAPEEEAPSAQDPGEDPLPTDPAPPADSGEPAPPASTSNQSGGRTPLYARAPGKPSCSYGGGCYRKNPAHFAEEDHPADHPLIVEAAAKAKAQQ